MGDQVSKVSKKQRSEMKKLMQKTQKISHIQKTGHGSILNLPPRSNTTKMNTNRLEKIITTLN